MRPGRSDQTRWRSGVRPAFLRGVGLGCLLFVLSLTAWARPAQIIILRHAEKPANDDEVHLSERGRERARALAPWISTNAVFQRHGPPVALFAARAISRNHSRRPAETLSPLSSQLHLPILTPFAAKEHAALAAEIMKNPAYDGRTVVICWVHDYLPELAQDFGAKARKWDNEIYDRVWLITFDKGKAALKNLPQRLLPGDATR